MLCDGVTVLGAEPTVSRPFNWLNAYLGCHSGCAYIYIKGTNFLYCFPVSGGGQGFSTTPT